MKKACMCDRANAPIELSLLVLFAYLCTSVKCSGHFPGHVQTSKANFQENCLCNLNSKELQRHGHRKLKSGKYLHAVSIYFYLESIRYGILSRVDITISSGC